MDETELQHRLTRLAEHTAPPPREALAQVVVARHRVQRRQAVGLTAVVAAVVAVVVAVPSLLGGPSSEPVTADAVGSAGVDVLAGPTRGSLAGDAAFVEGVRQLPWTGPDLAGSATPEPPVATRRVVFAGDVAGARWALVAGANTARPVDDDPDLQTDLGALGEVAVAWFTGPPGAPPEQMSLQGVPHGVDPTAPRALVDAACGGLVVVTAPGDTVELSLRPEVAADATVRRSWQPVDAPDGVAVVTLPSGTPAAALAYRVTRAGQSSTWTPDSTGVQGGTTDVPVTLLRPATAPAGPSTTVSRAVNDLLERLGLAPEDVSFALSWSGDVPAPHVRPARADVLTAVLPSGAGYTEVELSLELADGSVAATRCGSELRPAGTPVADQVVAVRCDATDFSANSDVVRSLVIVAPPGTASARALDPSGAVLAGFALDDGVAVVPFPEPTTAVQTLAADGTVVTTTPLMTHAGFGG